MRRLVLGLLVLLIAPMLMGGGLTAPRRHLDLSEADRAALDGISLYLNGIATMKGSFIQIGPNGGVDQGAFYISKPGKMRFVYDPPSPTLIISDGHTVAVANTRLNTVDRYRLSQTPLDLVLDNEVDLLHDSALVSVEHQQGSIAVGLRINNIFSQTNITLIFSEPEYELRQWSVIDNQGLTTTVALRDVVPGAVLSPSLFLLPKKNPFVRHPQD